jgi:DNA invertase Pin-like site-specific DNA recombinase
LEPSAPFSVRDCRSCRRGTGRASEDRNAEPERGAGGTAKAKAAGVYKGRPPSIEASRVSELKSQGMRPTDIAKALRIGRASVYRILGQKAAS